MAAPLGILLCAGALSLFARCVLDLRLTMPDARGWVVTDADSQYQLRRVERVFQEGLPVADSDPDLAWPGGKGIQWPPGYPLLCWAALAPFAPADAAARAPWLEHAMGSLPLLFGVASTLLAVLGGALLGGATGALVAGGLHALAFGSIGYSAWGVADYHALSGLLAGALPLLLAAALHGQALSRRASALRHGAFAGLLAGWLWVTWLGAVHHVLTLDAALGLLLFLERGERRAHLAAWSLAFQLATLAFVLPCSLASPWLELHPWSAEFMSWLQPALLGAGALVLAPAALAPPGSALVRRWPAVATGLVLALLAGLLLVPNPLITGLREGVQSATGAGAFAEIAESRPLLGAGIPFADALGGLGLAGLLLPLALAAALFQVLRDRRALPMLPVMLSAAALLVLSLLQRRFSNELALPTAVLIGWVVARGRPQAVSRLPLLARALLGVLLVALLQAPTVVMLAQELDGSAAPRFPAKRLRAQQHLVEWLAERTPAPPDYSVMASWGYGNALLWVARRPDVSTQFGYYLGEESRLAPSRFFLADDLQAGLARLEHHRSRYVIVNPPDAAAVANLAAMLGPEVSERFVATRAPGEMAIRAAFEGTLWGRLLVGNDLLGSFPGAGASGPHGADRSAPPTLRLVHVGEPDARGQPVGWIFERVEGAVVTARPPAGTPLRVRVEVAFPGLPRPLVFAAEALPGADGTARVRIPYATAAAERGTTGDAPGRATGVTQGDGRATGPATWSAGGQSGKLEIREQDVAEGRVLELGSP